MVVPLSRGSSLDRGRFRCPPPVPSPCLLGAAPHAPRRSSFIVVFPQAAASAPLSLPCSFPCSFLALFCSARCVARRGASSSVVRLPATRVHLSLVRRTGPLGASAPHHHHHRLSRPPCRSPVFPHPPLVDSLDPCCPSLLPSSVGPRSILLPAALTSRADCQRDAARRSSVTPPRRLFVLSVGARSGDGLSRALVDAAGLSSFLVLCVDGARRAASSIRLVSLDPFPLLSPLRSLPCEYHRPPPALHGPSPLFVHRWALHVICWSTAFPLPRFLSISDAHGNHQYNTNYDWLFNMLRACVRACVRAQTANKRRRRWRVPGQTSLTAAV